jgi:hypothetical protein
MSEKKAPEKKYPQVNVTLRPDQAEKVKRLQAARRLSSIFQDAVDAAEI